ncbi:MAG: GxxExxY protein [Vicinamibacterales bacterium]
MSLRTTPVARQVIGCAIAVHRELGPGLLESAYEPCLEYELLKADLRVVRQVPIPLDYRGLRMDCAFRADLIVQDAVLVEVKCVNAILPLHVAQVLTYLKLTGLREALIINFNEALLKDGLRSVLC